MNRLLINVTCWMVRTIVISLTAHSQGKESDFSLNKQITKNSGLNVLRTYILFINRRFSNRNN